MDINNIIIMNIPKCKRDLCYKRCIAEEKNRHLPITKEEKYKELV